MAARNISDQIEELRGRIVENTFAPQLKYERFRLGFLFDVLRHGGIKMDDVPEPTKGILTRYADLVGQAQRQDPERKAIFDELEKITSKE